MTTPTEAFERLGAAERDGTLARFAERHGLSLVVVFGSTARGEPSPRDLDVAVASRGGGVDPIAVVTDLMALTGTDDVDLLDLDRAGPVAGQHALVGGERLSIEWMRRRALVRLAAG